MGEPKATDMPEAAAADRTSLFRAAAVSLKSYLLADETGRHTFIIVDARKQLRKDIGATTRNMDQGPFLAQPHARRNSEDLSKSANAHTPTPACQWETYQTQRLGNQSP